MSEKQFVWPWTGIVVNIPTYSTEDDCCVRKRGSKLKDEYQRRIFNPRTVCILSDLWGHSGTAVVEFNKNWTGLDNAFAFEREYELDHYGKKDWFANTELKSEQEEVMKGHGNKIQRDFTSHRMDIVMGEIDKLTQDHNQDYVSSMALPIGMQKQCLGLEVYDMQFELNEIESRREQYPSTISFLNLINALIAEERDLSDRGRREPMWIPVKNGSRLVPALNIFTSTKESSPLQTQLPVLELLKDFMSGKTAFWNIMSILLPGVNSVIAERSSQLYGHLLENAVQLSLETIILVFIKICFFLIIGVLYTSSRMVGLVQLLLKSNASNSLIEDYAACLELSEEFQNLENNNDDPVILIMQVILDILDKFSKPDANALLHEFGFQHLDMIGIAPLPKRNSNQSLRNSSLHQRAWLLNLLAVELHAGDVRSSNHREACQTILSFLFAHGMNDIDASENTAIRTVNKSKDGILSLYSLQRACTFEAELALLVKNQSQVWEIWSTGTIFHGHVGESCIWQGNQFTDIAEAEELRMEQINLVVGILSKVLYNLVFHPQSVWPYEETDEYDFVQGLFGMMHALFSRDSKIPSFAQSRVSPEVRLFGMMHALFSRDSKIPSFAQSRVSPENQRNSELRMFNLCYSLSSYLYFLVTKKSLRLQPSDSSSSYTSVELQQPTLSLLNSLFSSVTTALERAAGEKSLLLNKVKIPLPSPSWKWMKSSICVRQDSVSSSDNIQKRLEVILGTKNGQLHELAVNDKDKKEKYIKFLLIKKTSRSFYGFAVRVVWWGWEVCLHEVDQSELGLQYGTTSFADMPVDME
ncbi:hypothetical protein VNO78_02605 [Psophocarpus tetragonolobus]|uniref:XS domain-containing protein n=1 Tax=Psophocarpus tetragonolobus TaxID=3891 RepID=A0AAN9T050_PSOTE